MNADASVAKTQRGARRRVVALGVAGCTVALLVAELVTRALLPRPGFRPFPPDVLPGMLVPHASRGYAYPADFSGRIVTPDFTVTLQTNALGMRDRPVDPPDSRTPRILALGDSFTFGFGIEAQDAWPARLETQLRDLTRTPLRVYNGAVSAYGLVQIRDRAEELVGVLRPSVLILGLFPPATRRIKNPYTYFHGYAVVQSEIPRLRVIADGFLHSDLGGPRARSVDFWLDEHLMFPAHMLHAIDRLRHRIRSAEPGDSSSPDSLPGEQVVLMLQQLDSLLAVAQGASAELVVLIITNQRPDGSFPEDAAAWNRGIATWGRDHGVRVVDPLPALRAATHGEARFRNGRDSHWSPAAHQIAAESLAATLRDQLLAR